jgi:3-deoxy-D-manno-octulosonic-acid transferase
MVLLYNLLLRLYYVLVLVASISNSKAKKWIQGRRGLLSKMAKDISSEDEIVWFHCASLGEFEQGRPVIEAMKQQDPSIKVLLTFFSPSGYEVRKNYEGADYIYYLPLDTYFNAVKFVRIAHPKVAIFVKYEFWFHYIQALKKQEVPTYVISAIFRPDQVFFKWYGGLFRLMLRSYRHLFVQNQQSEDLLKTIGISNVTICGDTRFDRVAQIAKNAKQLPLVEALVGQQPCIIAGSTWPEDETLLASYIKQHPELRMVVAPHEIGKGHVQEIMGKLSGVKVARYTQTNIEEAAKAQVLVVDTIGILSSIYRYGQVAYIGGGFGVGIHNTLEAATWGMPVVFGPNYHKFQEAKDLISAGASFSISNETELSKVFDNLLGDSNALESAAGAAKRYVAANIGATQSIISKVEFKS